MGIDTILSKLLDLFKKRPVSDLTELEKYYRSRIENIKTDYESAIKKIKYDYGEQLAEIKSHRYKHPDNGVELDSWGVRANEAYAKLIAANEENMILREQVIFLQMELDMIKKKMK